MELGLGKLAVALLLAGCSSAVSDETIAARSAATAAAPAPTATPGPVAPLVPGKARVAEGGGFIIGTLQLRNESLVIRSGRHGLRFAVVTNDGIVAADLDESELAARHQALFQIYRTSYAQGAPYLDALVDPPVKVPLPSAQSARLFR